MSGGAMAAGTVSAGIVSGGTISGGTISGGTISGASLSGVTISGAIISGATVSGRRAGSPETPSAKGPAEPRPATPHDNRARRPPPLDRSASGKRESGAPGQRTTPNDNDQEDEEDIAARALERTLVQRGALVLPAWTAEVALGLTYGHTSQDTVATIVNQGTATTVGVRRRSHQLTASLTSRLGLPSDFQLEASVPASRVWSDVAVAGAARNDAFGFGLGDPRFSLTWQPIHGGSSWP